MVQNRFKTAKEWAYAGIAFTFLGAFTSRAFVNDAAFDTIFPLFVLAFMAIPYVLWKKQNNIRNSKTV